MSVILRPGGSPGLKVSWRLLHVALLIMMTLDQLAQKLKTLVAGCQKLTSIIGDFLLQQGVEEHGFELSRLTDWLDCHESRNEECRTASTDKEVIRTLKVDATLGNSLIRELHEAITEKYG